MSTDRLGIDDGDVVCLDGAHGKQTTRAYFAVLGDRVIEISSSEIIELEVEEAMFVKDHALETRPATLSEAFEFRFGDYEPTVTVQCLGCGRTFPESTPQLKTCECPVGVEIDDVEWPDIPG